MDGILLWGGFNLFVLLMVLLDLGVFHKKAHVISMKEATIWSIIWVVLALAFCGGIYSSSPNGAKDAAEFLSGYLVEKSLSVDNLFVFYMLFKYFQTDAKQQHRVLFYGLAGAVIMRSIMIFSGAALVEQFHWLMYVFGVFLIFTGIKLAIANDDEEEDLADNKVLKLVRRVMPNASTFVVTVVVVELMDVLFALDSIPAIFGITTNPFIIYTSNIFAIMGLRSLYFLLAGVIDRFHYLQHALSAILTFVGVKMVIAEWYPISVYASLSTIIGVMALAVSASIVRERYFVNGR